MFRFVENLIHKPYNNWVKKVESVQVRDGVFTPDRAFGTRKSTCLTSSDLLALVASREGYRAQRSNIYKMNAQRGIPKDFSFIHEFCLVDGNTIFDVTLSQFLDPQTGRMQCITGPQHQYLIESGYDHTDPIIAELLERGHLTFSKPQHITEYIDRLTSNEVRRTQISAGSFRDIPAFAPTPLRREALEYRMGYRFDTPIQDQINADIR